MNIDYFNILQEFYSDESWIVRNDSSKYENIEWKGKSNKPSEDYLISLAEDANRRTTARTMRQKRDAKLDDTDWIVIKSQELGEPVPTEWLEYRQSLRDISKCSNWPNLSDSDWPAKPQ